MIGQSISHYTILEKLGEGGMGVVYKALDTELHRAVALKFLPRYLTSDSAEKERFYHEARAASALNHPNVSTIYEIREFDNQLFLAMELVEGQTLKQLIAGESLQLKKILDIIVQACDGIAGAHEKGIVHRDIKSDNIMITPKGQVKIMDFGLAKVKGATKLTRAGSTLGTAAYMSPEQAQGLDVDHRSDIFSLGVVLYELLTGKLPFRGEHHAALMYSLVNEEPQPVARFNEKVTAELERVVGKALAKDPDERYQHVDELLADLRRERKQLEYARAGYASVPAMPVAPPPAKRRLFRMVVPIAVVLIALVLVVILNPFNFQITTQQSTASEQNTIAVMYFENVSDPEDQDRTARMVTSLLVTGLSESKSLKVLSTQRLYDILKQLGKEDAHVIDRGVATEVAKKAGAGLLLTGEVLQRTPVLVITVEVSTPDRGDILVAERMTGNPGEDIFSVVDRLSGRIRKNLLTDQQNRDEPGQDVAAMLTHSEEALRCYIKGVEYLNQLYLDDAAGQFENAISIDSTFAMAHYGLSVAHMNTPDAKVNITNAVRHADRATSRERDMILAYRAIIFGEVDEAIRLLKAVVVKYPDDKDARFRLGIAYRSAQRYDDAIREFTSTTDLDPLFKMGYNLLAYTYDSKGDFDKSIWAINKYIALAPQEANPYDTRGDLYSYHGKYREAIESYEKALSVKPDFYVSRSKAGYLYALLMNFGRADSCFAAGSMTQHVNVRQKIVADRSFLMSHLGKYSSALALVGRVLASDPGAATRWPDLFYARTEALLGAGKKGELLDAIQTFINAFPHSGSDEQWNARQLRVIVLAEFGEVQRAGQELERLSDGLSPGDSLRGRSVRIAAASVALKRNDYTSVLDNLKKSDSNRSIYHPYLMAQAYIGLEDDANAIAVLERALSSGSPELVGVFGGRLLYLLGLAYEHTGQTEKALAQYETFIEILKNAEGDPVFLNQARARAAQLRKSL